MRHGDAVGYNRPLTRTLFLLSLAAAACSGQRLFVTALGGISTLSADAATELDTANSASLYKPENGPAINLAAGLHLNDWFAVQGNWMWNRNDVSFTEIQNLATLVQDRHSSQNAGIGDFLIYFRGRQSRIRPYLSTGTGFVRIASAGTGVASGTITPVPGSIDTVKWAFRSAVGVDLLAHSGWGFRYSFSETLTKNPLSRALTPAGGRRLANFQSLFGVVWYF